MRSTIKKIRFYIDGETVINCDRPIIELNGRNPEDITEEMAMAHALAAPKRPEWENCQCIIMNVDEAPAFTICEQLYHENGEIKADTDWNKLLMPNCIVRNNALTKQVEIFKNSTEETLALEYARLQLLKSTGPKEDLFWTQKAIEGLDKRLGEGKLDKVEIRQQLEDKLASLEAPK